MKIAHPDKDATLCRYCKETGGEIPEAPSEYYCTVLTECPTHNLYCMYRKYLKR